MLGLGKSKGKRRTAATPLDEKEVRKLLKVAAEGQEAALRAIAALKAEVASLRRAMRTRPAPATRPAARRKAAGRRHPPAAPG